MTLSLAFVFFFIVCFLYFFFAPRLVLIGKSSFREYLPFVFSPLLLARARMSIFPRIPSSDVALRDYHDDAPTMEKIFLDSQLRHIGACGLSRRSDIRQVCITRELRVSLYRAYHISPLLYT